MLLSPRMGEEAIDWAKEESMHPTQNWYRKCLVFVRSCYGIPALAPNAGAAWDDAMYKHETRDPETIPRGVPVFWETSGIDDHVALSLGGALCISTDAVAAGKIDIVSIYSISSNWNCQLLGWTEDLNNYRIIDGIPISPIVATDELNAVGISGKSITRGALFL